jgi:nucleotide-binding universal stress UspA family protein
MYDRILVAIDPSPDSPDDSLNRTVKFAKMTGGTVHLLHVARRQNIPSEITVGADVGVQSAGAVDDREQKLVQDAVDLLAREGIVAHGVSPGSSRRSPFRLCWP